LRLFFNVILGGNYHENDISTQEQAEKERAWVEKEDEYTRRKEGYQGAYGKGQEEAYCIISR